MRIQLNGQPHELPDGTTLATLVDDLGLTGKRYAVEIDGELVPRSEHPRRVLQEGERVEVVQAIGGG